MSNRNHIIQRVASLISDTMDGDTVLLIDSYIPVALRSACKYVATVKPLGHEQLLITQEIPSGNFTKDTNEEYPRADLTTLTYDFIMQDRFHYVESYDENLLGTIFTKYRVYPVGSFQSLALAEGHQIPYYYVRENYIYFAYEDITGLKNGYDTLRITHYYYAPIDLYPEVLEEYLIAELVKLVSTEAQKQQMEKAEV